MSTMFTEPVPHPAGDAPRHLTDEVLQTAEEAVLTQAADMVQGEGTSQVPLTEPQALNARGSLGRMVSEHSAVAVLLAVVAGGLAVAGARAAWARWR